MGEVAIKAEQVFLDALVGTEQNVLFETFEQMESGWAFVGHAENYIKVVLPETVELSLYTEDDIVNQILKVKIIDRKEQYCISSLY